MLKRKNRLMKEKDFERVFKGGQTCYTKTLGIKVLDNDFDYPRIGVVVGNKVSKKAVERNKIKRRIKDSVKDGFEALTGKDVVLIALPPIVEKSYNEIKSEIEKNINKVLKKRR